MVNKSGKLASFRKSLKEVDVKLLAEPKATSLTSGSLSFKKNGSVWVGTPKTDYAIKPGAKVTITVTVKTNGKATFWGYSSYDFKYR